MAIGEGWVIVCYQGRSIIRYNQQTSPIIINYFSVMLYHQALACIYSSPLICDSRSDTSTQTDQREQHSDLHSHLLNADITKNISSKAKSSLCRNYMEKGFCPYGKKCQFAHGPEELRINMETNRSYKTKGCHAFAKKGYCLYGARCNFIHEQPQIQNSREKWTTIYSNHRETLKAVQNRERSRLLELLRR